MDQATLARAMEPFFTTKGVGKGTGLGLPMVQGLTAQSGGAMQIESEPGKGTLVSLWLPRAREGATLEAPQSVVQPGVTTAHRRLRVLVVDDDTLVRMGTADMLTDLGHDVVEASCAADALEILKSDSPFDAVITDFAMPGLNGLDLALKIEQTNPQIAVVLASGYAELPVRAGPPRFPRLGKPFTQEELGEILQASANARPSEWTLANTCG